MDRLSGSQGSPTARGGRQDHYRHRVEGRSADSRRGRAWGGGINWTSRVQGPNHSADLGPSWGLSNAVTGNNGFNSLVSGHNRRPTKLFAKGTCNSMCPVSERVDRQRQGRISVYEATDATKNMPFRQRVADTERTVKEYRRSAAGRDMHSPLQLRPLPVLETVVKYLLKDVYSKEWAKDSAANHGDEDESAVAVYAFVEDRLRAVRQDVVVQGLTGPATAKMLQCVANFYIVSGYLMCQVATGTRGFDPHLHGIELQAVLATLQEISSQARAEGLPAVAGEDEYSCHQVLHALGMTVRADPILSLEEVATSPGVSRVFSAAVKRLALTGLTGKGRDVHVNGPSNGPGKSFREEFPKLALAMRMLVVLSSGGWTGFFKATDTANIQQNSTKFNNRQSGRDDRNSWRPHQREAHCGEGVGGEEADTGEGVLAEPGKGADLGKGGDKIFVNARKVTWKPSNEGGGIPAGVQAMKSSAVPSLEGEGLGEEGHHDHEDGSVGTSRPSGAMPAEAEAAELGFGVRLRCLSHSLLLSVRCHALRAMNRSFARKEPVPLEDIVQMLRLRDTGQAFDLCRVLSLPVFWEEAGPAEMKVGGRAATEKNTYSSEGGVVRGKPCSSSAVENLLPQGRAGGENSGRTYETSTGGWWVGGCISEECESTGKKGWVVLKSVPVVWDVDVAKKVYPPSGQGNIREDEWVGIHKAHRLWELAIWPRW